MESRDTTPEDARHTPFTFLCIPDQTGQPDAKYAAFSQTLEATPVTAEPSCHDQIVNAPVKDELSTELPDTIECIICLKCFDVDNPRGPALLPCAHRDYHEFCMRTWFTVASSCPLCKAVATDTNVQQPVRLSKSVKRLRLTQTPRHKKTRLGQNESVNIALALEQSYNEFFGQTKPSA
jgi:hypothetical protein